MSAVAFTPLIISSLCFLAFIWCARLFGLTYLGVLTGCFYFALVPVFLKRSSLGWYDTDPYNLLFPFIFLGFFFKTIERKDERSALFYAAALALTLIFYSLIWQGWVFLFFMTLITAFCIGIFAWLFNKDLNVLRQQTILTVTFLSITFVLGLILYGWSFFSFFTEGEGELAKFTVKGLNLWPNLFLEVGELKKATWGDAYRDTGGLIFLGLSTLGLVRSLIKPSLKTIPTALFLLITALLTFKAERFLIFTLIPLSIFFGVAIDWMAHQLRPFNFSKILTPCLIILLLGWGWLKANENIRVA